jgi:ankyrin repeat protein
VNAINRHGKTPLHWAATCGNDAVAEILLAHGANIHARDEWGQTPLHSVFVVGSQFAPSLKIAERLIERGADINARDVHGRTPLMWAALSKRDECAAFLLSKGAQIDIFSASALGKLEQVTQLILEHPGLVCATNDTGLTPLHWAAQGGRVDVAALLLASGANIDARDGRGSTPLHEASALNQFAITQLLLAHDANIDARDNEGQTPANYAVQRGRGALAEMLYAQASGQ